MGGVPRTERDGCGGESCVSGAESVADLAEPLPLSARDDTEMRLGPRFGVDGGPRLSGVDEGDVGRVVVGPEKDVLGTRSDGGHDGIARLAQVELDALTVRPDGNPGPASEDDAGRVAGHEVREESRFRPVMSGAIDARPGERQLVPSHSPRHCSTVRAPPPARDTPDERRAPPAGET